MIQRVMPDLMGMKNILVLNDEAHHCYRQPKTRKTKRTLKGDEPKKPRKTTKPPVFGFPDSKP